jgi:predicted transcriptional regulator of viral defense system
MKIREFIDHLTSQGIRSFTIEEIKAALGKSDKSIWNAIERLKSKGELASPAKGFYLIIPPEYRVLRCLPPDLFLPQLMAFWQRDYYICLLSAAMYNGAAHQQPQIFQVMMNTYHSMIHCGKVRIEFSTKLNLIETPLQLVKTAAGYIRVSTSEATAMDLVNYTRKCGGLNNIITVLTELSNVMNPDKLLALAEKSHEKRWIQRLGYLLEFIGSLDLSTVLFEQLKLLSPDLIPLDPTRSMKRAKRDVKWKIAINTDLESDL